MIPIQTTQTSLLAQELAQEIGSLVEDFRARKPGVQDWELEAGLALARERMRARNVRMALAVGAACLAVMVLGMALALVR